MALRGNNKAFRSIKGAQIEQSSIPCGKKFTRLNQLNNYEQLSRCNGILILTEVEILTLFPIKDNNKQNKPTIMKLAPFAIGSILFIEAFLLMYSPQEKYNLHTFVGLVKSYFSDCECLAKMSFDCVEDIRLFLVALVLTGAFSLTFGCSAFVGLVAQLVWTVTQSESYYSSGLRETLSTLTQVVFVLILLTYWIKSAKRCKEHKNIEGKCEGKAQQSSSHKPVAQNENQSMKKEGSVSGESKQNKAVVEKPSQESGVGKYKKKKNK